VTRRQLLPDLFYSALINDQQAFIRCDQLTYRKFLMHFYSSATCWSQIHRYLPIELNKDVRFTMDQGSVLVHNTKTASECGVTCYNQKLSQLIW